MWISSSVKDGRHSRCWQWETRVSAASACSLPPSSCPLQSAVCAEKTPAGGVTPAGSKSPTKAAHHIISAEQLQPIRAYTRMQCIRCARRVLFGGANPGLPSRPESCSPCTLARRLSGTGVGCRPPRALAFKRRQRCDGMGTGHLSFHFVDGPSRSSQCSEHRKFPTPSLPHRPELTKRPSWYA
jgi:hypothetical protein